MIAPAWRGVPIIFVALLLAQIVPPRVAGVGVARADDRSIVSATANEAAPALQLDSLEGGRRRLEDEPGHVRLVHFFATYCEPCRPELASLDALRTDRSEAGLDILAISVAEPEPRLRRYFAEQPTGLTILLDRDRSASRTWRIEALPSTVIVDRGGRMRFAVRGALDWGRADVRAAVDAVLAPLAEPVITTVKHPEGHP